MKNDVLIKAAEFGYFRFKVEEKKSAIAAETAETLNLNLKDVAEILEAETEKRAIAYRKRESAKMHKALQEKPLTGGIDADVIPVIEGDKFILTTAQNNTDHNPALLGALLNFAKEKSAKLIIGETLYNKNSYLQPEEQNEQVYFDPTILPYMINYRAYLGNESLLFFGNAHVSPTAKDVLSGFQAATAHDLVVPATQVALQVLPALKGSRPRRMYGTGSVTKRNMLERKAGQTASFNSAGLYCEKQSDGTFNCRQLELIEDSMGFYDIDGCYYRADSIERSLRPASVQLGDVHSEQLDISVWWECLDFIKKLNPEHVVLHDVLDFSSRNHHNKQSMAFLYSQEANGNSIVTDINKVIEVINSLHNCFDGDVDIIASNHDAALLRYLEEKMNGIDRHIDPTNAEFQFAGCLALIQSLREGGTFNAIEWTCNIGGEKPIYDNRGNSLDEIHEFDRVNFYLEDASVIIGKCENVHGHRGANGARGSGAKGFAKLGIRINSGHTHSPAIFQGSYVAGVCSKSLDMGYNVGQSGWAYAHIVTWPNGQRQVIFMN
jgi:hypothetical protein